MKLTEFALVALAGRRLTQLVVIDTITEDFRAWWSKKFNGQLIEELVYCERCASVWSAAVVLVLSRIPGGKFLVNVLAASEIAVIAVELNELIGDRELELP